MYKNILNRRNLDSEGGDGGASGGGEPSELDKLKEAHVGLTTDIGKSRDTNKLLKNALGIESDIGGDDLIKHLETLATDKKAKSEKDEVTRREGLTKLEQLGEDNERLSKDGESWKSQFEQLTLKTDKSDFKAKLLPLLLKENVFEKKVDSVAKIFMADHDFKTIEDLSAKVKEWATTEDNLVFIKTQAEGGAGGSSGGSNDTGSKGTLETLTDGFN